MKLEKACFIKSIMFMFILLIFLPGIHGIKQEATSQSGTIERIDRDFKFITVNGAKILLSGNTKIMDEQGNILKTDALKIKLSVVIEGARSPEGFLAQKIIITTPKTKP
jgi:uncharacterized ubiquitin-like protein YukD